MSAGLTPTHRRVIIVAAVVLAAAIAGTAFALTRGGGGANPPTNGFDGGPPANAPSGSQDGSAFRQFQQCLEQHGVTVTPGERPDFNDSTMRSAMSACRRYLPARPGGFRGGDDSGGNA